MKSPDSALVTGWGRGAGPCLPRRPYNVVSSPLPFSSTASSCREGLPSAPPKFQMGYGLFAWSGAAIQAGEASRRRNQDPGSDRSSGNGLPSSSSSCLFSEALPLTGPTLAVLAPCCSHGDDNPKTKRLPAVYLEGSHHLLEQPQG